MRQIAIVGAVVLCFATGGVTAGQAQDVAGSRDHPIITRYPGSTIQWYEEENYRPYRLAVGPVTGYRHIDDWVDTEGQIARIYYALDDAERTDREVYENYKAALARADFDVLADGYVPRGTRGGGIGSRTWQGVFFAANPWRSTGAVNEMLAGSSTSGGSGTIIAKKVHPEGTVYVAVSVYQFRADRISALVDVVQEAPAETGLITVDAEALAANIAEAGRAVLTGVLFDLDTATLKPASGEALTQIALYLNQHPGKQFYVVGHTDGQGAFGHNRSLSEARARAVVEALVRDYGIEAERLEAHGVGPLVPAATNGSPAGRAANRRVELVERL